MKLQQSGEIFLQAYAQTIVQNWPVELVSQEAMLRGRAL